MLTEPMPNKFWQIPERAYSVVRLKVYQNWMLEHEGQIVAKGVMWKIIGKRIAPGIYRVFLVKD
jgi:hypothetical protein